MKNKTRVLAVFAMLGASLVLAGCPYHHRPHRPHIPHPHRLPHPLQPVDSVSQTEGLDNALRLSMAAKLRYSE